MNKNMPVALGWLFALLVIAGFAASSYPGDPAPPQGRVCRRRRCRVWAREGRRRSRSLVLVAVYLLNQERQRPAAPIVIQGVPWVVPLVAACRRRRSRSC